MRNTARALLLLVGLIIASAISARADDAGADLIAGRAIASQFLLGKTDELWQSMTPQMQKALGSEDAFEEVHASITGQVGEESEVLDERVIKSDGLSIYLRKGRWTKIDGSATLTITTNAGGRIEGLLMRPDPVAAESPFLDRQTKARLRLPFDGAWYVVWGGRTIEQNYHAADPAQRFALDLVIREGVASHRGDGKNLPDYYCWDKPILAPADATVVRAVNTLIDQPIGSSDPANPAGNHVVLDLGEGEFAFLAHFRQGSVQVQAGSKVAAGQEIGRCGNSGNTSEPHLHIHLQTTPDLQQGQGLPAQYRDYLADGSAEESGEPQQGQTIQPAP